MGNKLALFRDYRQWPDTFARASEYPPGPGAKKGLLMTYIFRDGNNRPIRRSYHGKAFHGTEGTLVIHRGGYRVYSLVRGRKKLTQEKSVPSGPVKHVQVFLTCARNRKKRKVDVETATGRSTPAS